MRRPGDGRPEAAASVFATLSAIWTEQLGTPVHVGRAREPGAQRGGEPALLSIYCRPDAGRRARAFFRDELRYTPRLARLPAQWVAGTLAATALAVRAGRTAFYARPAVPHADDVVVLPGNRRVRLFDFATGRCRVAVKAGCEPGALRAELALRQERRGPLVPVLASAADGSWYEEPLVDGFSLPRCPPLLSRRGLAARALAELEAFQAPTAARVDAAAHVEEQLAAVGGLLPGLVPDEPALRPALDRLAALARAPGTLETVLSHGDFQPGNVLVERSTLRIFLIDWEYVARRSRAYDPLVWHLEARFPAGLSARIDALLASAPRGLLARLGRGALPAAIAVFLLEDLRWRLEQAAALGGMTESLRVLIGELCRVSLP